MKKVPVNLNRRPSTSAYVLKEIDDVRKEVFDSTDMDIAEKCSALNRLLRLFTDSDYYGKSSSQIELIMVSSAYQVLKVNSGSGFSSYPYNKEVI